MIKPRHLSPGERVAVVSLSSGKLGEKKFIHKFDLAKERLAKDFEGGARKLRELVEKEDAAMRERYFPRKWLGSATEKTNRTHGVVRRTERP